MILTKFLHITTKKEILPNLCKWQFCLFISHYKVIKFTQKQAHFLCQKYNKRQRIYINIYKYINLFNKCNFLRKGCSQHGQRNRERKLYPAPVANQQGKGYSRFLFHDFGHWQGFICWGYSCKKEGFRQNLCPQDPQEEENRAKEPKKSHKDRKKYPRKSTMYHSKPLNLPQTIP